MTIPYNANRMEEMMENVTSVIEKVLDTNREIAKCCDVNHTYDDKYAMAEFMGSGGIGAICMWLHHLGLSKNDLIDLSEETFEGDIQLMYSEVSSCTFIEKSTRTVTAPNRRQTKIAGLGSLLSITEKSTTEVTEFHWDYKTTSEIFIKSKNITKRLASIPGHTKITTRSDVSPKPSARAIDNVCVSLKWLLKQLSNTNSVCFEINRSSEECKTPRRNPEINNAINFFQEISSWSSEVSAVIQDSVLYVQETDQNHAAAVSTEMLFVPVVPFLVQKVESEEHQDPYEQLSESNDVDRPESHSNTVVLFNVNSKSKFMFTGEDLAIFVESQNDKLEEKKQNIKKMISGHSLVTSDFCSLQMLLGHVGDICKGFCDGVQYIEEQLRKQLIDALGKEVSPAEFTEYMDYHNRKLFKEGYDPSLFVFPVQRPGFYPEGLVSITRQPAVSSDKQSKSNVEKPISQPIYTLHHQQTDTVRFTLPIDGTITAEFSCKPHLHGHIEHCFSGGESGQKSNPLTIEATSRQFSGYIMLIGRVTEENSFETHLALVVKDKDCFDIDILTKSMSSSTDGMLNMKSLSPEQQRFSKAYREMMLKKGLFSILFIQIKPQLEHILNLPSESLTKEISLTKQITKLMIDYDIGIDALSRGDHETEGDPIQIVQQNVEKINTAISNIKMKSDNRNVQQFKFDKASGEVSTCPVKIGCQSDKLPPPESSHEQSSGGADIDITERDTSLALLPLRMSKRFDLFPDLSLQTSTMYCGTEITRKGCDGKILSKEQTKKLSSSDITPLHQQAMSLLDGLTKGGAVPLQAVDLHVISSTAHYFDKTLLNIVIQDNTNPVEKVELSTLLVASSIRGKPIPEIVNQNQVPRIQEFNARALA